MAGFAASLQVNAAKALLKVNNKCYDIARELFTMTVNLTPSPTHPGPFAKGLLANQWYPHEGIDFSSSVTTSTSSTGAASLGRISTLRGFAFDGKDGTITFTNNVPYAVQAEFIGWPRPVWSGRPGYFMVRMSLQAVAAKHR